MLIWYLKRQFKQAIKEFKDWLSTFQPTVNVPDKVKPRLPDTPLLPDPLPTAGSIEFKQKAHIKQSAHDRLKGRR